MRHFLEVINFVEPFEHGRRLSTRETVETDVVAAAFHVGRREGFRQHLLEKWNVFLHQLFLQILRAGGNDDAPVATEGRGNGGDEISERLSRAGTRLDDEMPLLLKR